jgi:hypothetical protein
VLVKRHTSNSRKRWDGFVSAAEGSLCAIAEIPLVISLLGEHAKVEEAVNTGLTSTLDDLFSELADVVAVNFLAPVLAMQEAGHANRLPCRRRAVGNAVGTLAIVCYVDLRLTVWKIATSHNNKRLQERKSEGHVSRKVQREALVSRHAKVRRHGCKWGRNQLVGSMLLPITSVR